MESRFAAALAVVALAGAALGQNAGQPAPDIRWHTTYNFGKVKNQKLSDLRGSAVLIEVWGTH
jgi:hypothetical protein